MSLKIDRKENKIIIKDLSYEVIFLKSKEFQLELLSFSSLSYLETNWKDIVKSLNVKSCFYKGEEDLTNLGFYKVDNISIYYPFGILFRIDDLNDGSFYIGITEIKHKWEDGYLGTGSDKWQNHLNKHPDSIKYPDNPKSHHYKRTILKDRFDTPIDLRLAEQKEIRKYGEFKNGKFFVTNPKCKNNTDKLQNQPPLNIYFCEECNGKKGKHKKSCSKYNK